MEKSERAEGTGAVRFEHRTLAVANVGRNVFRPASFCSLQTLRESNRMVASTSTAWKIRRFDRLAAAESDFLSLTQTVSTPLSIRFTGGTFP